LHLKISQIGQALEKDISQLELRDVYFAKIRQDIRRYIRNSSQGKELEKLVEELLLAKKVIETDASKITD
jgi:hypothetical protein